MSLKLLVSKVVKPLAMVGAGVGIWYGNKQWDSTAQTLHIDVHDKKSMLKVFDSIDTDHSGGISRTELRTALEKEGKNVNKLQMDTLFQVADQAKDGVISREEWIRVLEHTALAMNPKSPHPIHAGQSAHDVTRASNLNKESHQMPSLIRKDDNRL